MAMEFFSGLFRDKIKILKNVCNVTAIFDLLQTFLRTLKQILWKYNGDSTFHVDLEFGCLLKFSIQL